MDEVSLFRLRSLYASVDAEVAAAAPRCEASGRCCRFTEFDHILFLTELEAEFLMGPGIPANKPVDDHGCPYQNNGLCTARERRPLSCRIFFCDPEYANRQQAISERSIRRLKELHTAMELPWRYGPLIGFLEGRTGRRNPCLDAVSDAAPAELA